MKIVGTPGQGIHVFKKDHKKYASFGFKFNEKNRTIEISGTIKTDHAKKRVNSIYKKLEHKIEKTKKENITQSLLEKTVKKALPNKKNLIAFDFKNN